MSMKIHYSQLDAKHCQEICRIILDNSCNSIEISTKHRSVTKVVLHLRTRRMVFLLAIQPLFIEVILLVKIQST